MHSSTAPWLDDVGQRRRRIEVMNPVKEIDASPQLGTNTYLHRPTMCVGAAGQSASFGQRLPGWAS